MSMIHTRIVVALGCLLAVGMPIFAGDLNPPAGAVAPTMKTLDEVEPRIAINDENTPGDADSVYRISQSGSYYLTGNIGPVGSGKSGIEIAVSDVTIDLNGFVIFSFGVVSNASDGIRANALTENITIRNGTIRGMNGQGINLDAARGCLVESVVLRTNNNSGLILGDQGVARDCRALLNGSNGISTGLDCLVEQCYSSGNQTRGFFVGNGSVIVDSVASNNVGIGFQSNSGATIRGCIAKLNNGNGIHAGGDSSVTACTANENGDYGIFAASGTTVQGCSANENAGIGIYASRGSVIGCVATENSGVGINIFDGSIVKNCVASHNDGGGILVASHSQIIENNCLYNGVIGGTQGDGAGIRVTGSDNRVVGNNCMLNDYGYDVAGPGNILSGNTCADNDTNWVVVSNNKCLVINAISGGAAFTGNSGGTSPGSNDPNANYTY